ncbi:MAG TPA: response regulator [Lacunisphaera sp.]|nr:response regulator [Lacunisphaera sp.]
MSEPSSTSRPWLLLVEDEAPLAEAVRANLAADYEVEVAGTVEEALLLLGSRQYAAIVSDHMLPGDRQGLDFLMEALVRQPGAKRILMTGYLNPDLINRSVAIARLSACLIKPVPMARLRQELHLALTS